MRPKKSCKGTFKGKGMASGSPNSLLDRYGYIHLTNVLTPAETNAAESAITSKTVNYPSMTRFIQQAMLRRIQNALGWSYILHSKYRVSDNNNSNDASCFHRDVIPANVDLQTTPTGNLKFPVYTCLTYLDSTTMEIIPGSHLVPKMSLPMALNQFGNNCKRIAMKRGDLLVFHATLLHRGIFTERLPHRRLIQVFDVFNNLAVPRNIDVLHVPATGTDGWKGNLMVGMSRVPGLIDFLNLIGYLNAATGYNQPWSGQQSANQRSPKPIYYSSEASCVRHSPNDSQGPINVYILNSRMAQLSDLPAGQRAEFVRQCYTIPYTLYSGCLLLLCVVVIWMISGAIRYARYNQFISRH